MVDADIYIFTSGTFYWQRNVCGQAICYCRKAEDKGLNVFYHPDQIDGLPTHFQEADLFEKREAEDPKQTPQIGKIQTKDLFSSGTNEDKGFTFIF